MTEGARLQTQDLAIDLGATARTDTISRIFWEGDYFVRLGIHNIDCSLALQKLNKKTRISFKQHFLKFVTDKAVGLRVAADLLAALNIASRKSPPTKFNAHWVGQALENETFRRCKHSFRKFLEYWKDRYVDATTEDTLNLLAQAACSKRASNNVESDDPEKSWLTDEEYDDLLQVIWQHYDETGAVQPTLIRLLSMQYARRPQQLSQLKFEDLKLKASEAREFAEPEIHFPGAKERDTEEEFRSGKIEPHPVAQHLWDMLQIQRKKVSALFKQELNFKLTEDEVDKLPIFTSRIRIKAAKKILTRKLGLILSENFHDELFHLNPAQLIQIIRFTHNGGSSDLSVRQYGTAPILPISRRTGETLVTHTIRLRHTRVRQLARQGVPKSILSHWLGHNSDKALNSYYHDPAEEARQLDLSMSKGLVPLAQAFHGRIITTDAEATRADDPNSRLEFADEDRLSYIGNCGKFSFCSTTSIPIPCYRCKHFEPLANAPHEEVLDALRYRQRQENELLKRGSMRNLLIPIDLSADIRAVERCLELCKAKLEERQ